MEKFNDTESRVRYAASEAPDAKEFLERNEMGQNIDIAEYYGHINADEAEALHKEIGRTMQGGVIFDTADELEHALRITNLSAEKISEIVEHERAHAQLAERHGFNPKYILRFGKCEDGSYLYVAGISLGNYGNVSKEALKDIIQAPDEMSSSDQRLLDEIS